jgi:preprotein translocase subunit SecD
VTNPTGWVVDVELSPAGARAYFSVSQAAYESDPSGSGLDTCGPARGCNALAIVYDGAVINTVTVVMDGIQGGLVAIPGLSRQRAKQLAAALNPS